MNISPSCQQTTNSPEDPMDRHPHKFEHGLYVSDSPGFGGVQGFCWFANCEDAIHWLQHELPILFDDDDGTVAAALGKTLTGICELTDLDLDKVNRIAKGLFEVRWAGTFSSLMFGDHPFARSVQSDFHDMIFPDERGQGPNETMDEDFAEHLHNYRSA